VNGKPFNRVPLTRRRLLQTAGTLLASSPLARGGSWDTGERESYSATQQLPDAVNDAVFYGKRTLPRGIRSRLVDNNNGLVMHILEAGFEEPRRPCVVLLHGFPELAFAWRNQLLPLASAGFHAIAPDLRGYGLTTPRPVSFSDSLLPYMVMNRVTDVLGLVRAIGYESVACVVGHDWGGPTAVWCARTRPDVFRSVVSMSTPFQGAPYLPLDSADGQRPPAPHASLEEALAALPRPRQLYTWYYAGTEANDDLWHAPQGVHDLLRAMWYFKSADWKGNKPFPLTSSSASEFSKLPAYYVMDLHTGMAQTVAEHMPSEKYIASCRWLTEADLDVYTRQYARTGFQGGLNSYRILVNPEFSGETKCFSDRTVNVPACFIAGAEDWGVRQAPGAFESMGKVCTRLLGAHLIPRAGHWVAEEQPTRVTKLLLRFLQEAQGA
jgi:pimeloyl-ACP methyl ester carboxylesterase